MRSRSCASSLVGRRHEACLLELLADLVELAAGRPAVADARQAHLHLGALLRQRLGSRRAVPRDRRARAARRVAGALSSRPRGAPSAPPRPPAGRRSAPQGRPRHAHVGQHRQAPVELVEPLTRLRHVPAIGLAASAAAARSAPLLELHPGARDRPATPSSCSAWRGPGLGFGSGRPACSIASSALGRLARRAVRPPARLARSARCRRRARCLAPLLLVVVAAAAGCPAPRRPSRRRARLCWAAEAAIARPARRRRVPPLRRKARPPRALARAHRVQLAPGRSSDALLSRSKPPARRSQTHLALDGR